MVLMRPPKQAPDDNPDIADKVRLPNVPERPAAGHLRCDCLGYVLRQGERSGTPRVPGKVDGHDIAPPRNPSTYGLPPSASKDS